MKNIAGFILVVIFTFVLRLESRTQRNSYYITNQKPLIAQPFTALPLGAIKPDGNARIEYGVLTSYPCCTCNMHQGWPKFIQNLWYATAENGLAAMVYGPSNVKAKVSDGTEVTFTEKTNYPFSDKIEFVITFCIESKLPRKTYYFQ